MAWYEQHGGLTRVYVSCFVVVIGRKWSFDMISASHGQTAFCSYVLGQIALYLQKVIRGKNKTSLVHVRLLSGIGSESSAIFEHSVYTIHFLFVFRLSFEKREGEFLATTIFPLATKNLYLVASWRPY